MNKTLINNYESFCSFIEAHTGIIPGNGNVASDFWNSPEKISLHGHLEYQI